MARRLIVWGGIGGVATALLVIGLGTLATRRPVYQGGRGGEDSQLEERRRKSGTVLAVATIQLAAARERFRVVTLLDGSTDPTSIAMVVDAEEWRDSARQGSLARALRQAWGDLGLDVTKVAVGVVVLDRATIREWARGLSLPPGEPVAFYVLPDSLAPTSCVAMVLAPPTRSRAPQDLRAIARTWFGPCAYYARFGIPAPRVRQWLETRGLDLARIPDWSREGEPRPPLPGLLPSGPGKSWYWWSLYLMPSSAAGCLAARAARCRAAVAFGDGVPSAVAATFVPQLDQQWRLDRQYLPGGERFLGAVVREVGARRFQEFWRTTLPVDSALTIALGHPVGEWTARWERSVAAPPRFGPGPRWDELLVGLSLIVGATTLVGRNVRLREVR